MVERVEEGLNEADARSKKRANVNATATLVITFICWGSSPCILRA